MIDLNRCAASFDCAAVMVFKMKRYKLVFADDEKMIRDGILSSVDFKALGFDVVGAFENGQQVLDFLSENEADVLFTDVVMDDVSGIDLAEWIYINRPEMSVVLLTGYSDFQTARRAVEYRVRHIIMKPTNPSEIRHVFLEVVGEMIMEEQKQAGNSEIRADEIKMTGEDAMTHLLDFVRQYIKENINRSISLQEISDRTHYSKGYLTKLLKQATGYSFVNYHTMLRMEEAKNLLKNSQLQVNEIAKKVGYADDHHFIRTFRKMTGMSALEYRKRSL